LNFYEITSVEKKIMEMEVYMEIESAILLSVIEIYIRSTIELQLAKSTGLPYKLVAISHIQLQQ